MGRWGFSMLPGVWLAHRGFIKLRTKAPDWTREDLLALAQQEFNKHDIDKKQLDALSDILRAKVPPVKPLPVYYKAETEVSSAFLREVRWVDNGEFKESEESQWVPSSKHLKLVFGTVQEMTAWAITLLESETRNQWAGHLKLWRARTRLSAFGVPAWLPRFTLTSEAAKALGRRQSQDQNMLLPLPDSAEMRKRYFSLEEGDTLAHKEDGTKLIVTKVRVNLDTPPTYTFEKEDAHG